MLNYKLDPLSYILFPCKGLSDDVGYMRSY